MTLQARLSATLLSVPMQRNFYARHIENRCIHSPLRAGREIHPHNLHFHFPVADSGEEAEKSADCRLALSNRSRRKKPCTAQLSTILFLHIPSRFSSGIFNFFPSGIRIVCLLRKQAIKCPSASADGHFRLCRTAFGVGLLSGGVVTFIITGRQRPAVPVPLSGSTPRQARGTRPAPCRPAPRSR